MGMWRIDNRGNEVLVYSMENNMEKYDFYIAEIKSYGWYIAVIDSKGQDYLHKDLEIHSSTGYESDYGCGKSPGYYPSREIAETYLRAYLNKGNQMKFIMRQNTREWYIRALKNDRYAAWFVWKDLELHIDRGWNSNCRTAGDGMGYYFNKETAEYYLKLFKEKHNMENIEITVKVNGIEIPLHKISEQTLLTVRENSKPKEVPVARVGNYPGEPEEKRLLLKVVNGINVQAGQVIAINLNNGNICGRWPEKDGYDGNFYDNIQVIS